jgi:hypothetical protein
MRGTTNTAAVKEGIKKAQAFSALHKLGGMLYFCTNVEMAERNVNVLVETMAGVNKDKKAASWGKFLISCNDNAVCAVGHVPSDLASSKGFTVHEWKERLMEMATKFAGCSVMTLSDGTNDEFVKFVIDVDPMAETFPFKLCDAIVAHSTTVLKEMGLISAAPSSSREDEDDDIDYAGALDMVW